MQPLFQLLTELSWHCRTDQQYLIRNQLDRLVATVRAQDFDPHEEAQLKDAADRVRTAMEVTSQWTCHSRAEPSAQTSSGASRSATTSS